MQTFSVDRIVHSCSGNQVGYVPMRQSVVAHDIVEALDIARQEWPDTPLRVKE